MKKYITRLALGSFIMLSAFCFFYVNHVETHADFGKAKYEQLTQSTDKMVAGVKSVTLVFEKVVDLLTNREV